MSRPETKPAVAEAAPTVVYLALLAYVVGSSLFVRISTATQVGYALCAAAATLLPAMLRVRRYALPDHARRVALVAVAVSAAYLIPAALLPQGRTLQHVAVDFATTMVPIGFFALGSMAPQTFRRILEPRWVLVFVLASLCAPLIVLEQQWARSFEPPDVGVIVLLAVVAITEPRRWAREPAAVGLAVFAVLAGLSGSRSIFFIAVIAFALTLLANRTARVLALLGLLAALIVWAAAPRLPTEDFRDSRFFRSTSRVLDAMRPGGVELTSGRLRENALIFADMRTRSTAWTLVGIGHGAVFEPEDWHQPRTISEEGFVHNVHMGPVLMLFRYGVAGLALYAAVLIHAAVTTVRLLRRRATPGADATALLYALGTSLFMVEFVARNVLPNPLFSFFLAGYGITVLGGGDHRDGPHGDAADQPP